MKIAKKLIGMIEDHDFKIYQEDDNVFEFQKYSPAGQDFSFTIDTEGSLDYFLHNILEYYCDFDVSYETSLWLDSDGHGKNGAPYDMKDLYEDMKVCHEFIIELYNIVDKYINSIRRKR